MGLSLHWMKGDALVRAAKGVIAIDNFHKLKESDRAFVQEEVGAVDAVYCSQMQIAVALQSSMQNAGSKLHHQYS